MFTSQIFEVCVIGQINLYLCLTRLLALLNALRRSSISIRVPSFTLYYQYKLKLVCACVPMDAYSSIPLSFLLLSAIKDLIVRICTVIFLFTLIFFIFFYCLYFSSAIFIPFPPLAYRRERQCCIHSAVSIYNLFINLA